MSCSRAACGRSLVQPVSFSWALPPGVSGSVCRLPRLRSLVLLLSSTCVVCPKYLTIRVCSTSRPLSSTWLQLNSTEFYFFYWMAKDHTLGGPFFPIFLCQFVVFCAIILMFPRVLFAFCFLIKLIYPLTSACLPLSFWYSNMRTISLPKTFLFPQIMEMQV